MAFISREERGMPPARATRKVTDLRRILVAHVYHPLGANFHIGNGDVYEWEGWQHNYFGVQSDTLCVALRDHTDESMDALLRLLHEADARAQRPLIFMTEPGNEWLNEWRETAVTPADLVAEDPEPAEDILHWQAFLVGVGYLQGDLTGVWDTATEQATEKIEAQIGLPPGGPLGDLAVGWCEGVLDTLRAAEEIRNRRPDPAPEPDPYGFRGFLKFGSTGEAVAMLNKGLRALKFACGEDDAYTTRTVKGVRQFQVSEKLPANGQVDYTTWTRLFNRVRGTLEIDG